LAVFCDVQASWTAADFCAALWKHIGIHCRSLFFAMQIMESAFSGRKGRRKRLFFLTGGEDMQDNPYTYSDEQIRSYFERIHWQGTREFSLENLTGMHRQHLLSIPYENLDLIQGVPLSLAPEALFQKIITGHRGGYCFELQGAFFYLLKSLGYEVRQYAGRFMDEPGVIQMRRHRILVVSLGGRRYVLILACAASPRESLSS
jgi:hypothetical protein